MKLSNIIKTFAMLAIAFASCTKTDLDIDNSTADLGESVEVSLTLSVDAISAGTAEALSSQTKAVATDDDPSTTVKNLWIIQVNGTDDDSKVVVSRYFPDYDPETSKVELIPNASEQTIIYLANTFRTSLELGLTATLADIKALSWNLSDDDDYCYTDGDSGEETQYMYMSGSSVTTIVGSDNITANLKRSIAKINFKINNVSGSNLTITSITMNGVPEVGYYYVNRDDIDEIFPSGVEVYSYTTIDDQSITEDNSATYTFYTPTNKQGIEDESVVSYTKPLYANSSASYITVAAVENEAGDDGDIGVYRYTFYLGADLERDYNLEPNTEYTYTVDFKSKGSVDTDLRITDLGSTDWRKDNSSNCYILNPVAETDKIFYIPVESRIDEFWGDTKYGNNPTNTIKNTTNWTYEVLWYDCATDPIATSTSSDLTTSTMTIEKAESDAEYQKALKVTLGAGFSNFGNVVVAVKNNSGTILWSWHLWLTDYNPDSRTYNSRDAGAYTVDGGEIHRYAGTTWETSANSEKFIMDRNLGARNANEYVGSGAGALYYQWGSKNPIPGAAATYTSDTYGNNSASTTTTSPNLETTTTGVSFATSTQNPTTHYGISGNWCSESASSSNEYFWNDYKCPTTSGYTTKSIFDPSPLGWMLPISGTWDHFDDDRDSSIDGFGEYPYFDWASNDSSNWSGKSGRSYTVDGQQIAYYPASGSRNSTTGGLSNVGSNGCSWSATPNGSTSGYSLFFSSTGVNPTGNYSRSYGFPVRPIQE